MLKTSARRLCKFLNVSESGYYEWCGRGPSERALEDEAKKRLLERVKAGKLSKRSDLSLTDLAKELNPMVRGWLNYFRHFRISDTYPVLHAIDKRLVKWMKDKYKIGTRKAQRRIARMK